MSEAREVSEACEGRKVVWYDVVNSGPPLVERQIGSR